MDPRASARNSGVVPLSSGSSAIANGSSGRDRSAARPKPSRDSSNVVALVREPREGSKGGSRGLQHSFPKQKESPLETQRRLKREPKESQKRLKRDSEVARRWDTRRGWRTRRARTYRRTAVMCFFRSKTRLTKVSFPVIPFIGNELKRVLEQRSGSFQHTRSSLQSPNTHAPPRPTQENSQRK